MGVKRATGNEMNGGDAVHLSDLKVVGGCLAFDVRSGGFHRVNESAAFVIDELKRRTPVNALVASYAERYGISRAVAARDIELFLNDMAVVR